MKNGKVEATTQEQEKTFQIREISPQTNQVVEFSCMGQCPDVGEE